MCVKLNYVTHICQIFEQHGKTHIHVGQTYEGPTYLQVYSEF